MDTQIIFKPKNKTVIIADYREPEVIEHLKKLGAHVNEQNLKVGDFVCSGDGIVIERKTHSDFVSSIVDGRIFDQIRYMKENYQRPVIIIEGHSNREINENALFATVASLVTKYNASLINTKNSHDTAKMILWLAKKEQEDGKADLGFKQGKKSKDVKKLQEFILSSVPGISNVLAKRLLEHFGNVENVLKANEMELSKVKGMGKVLPKKIKKLVSTKYV
ncbi:MAG: hypothetical protein HYW22_00135 [Candidatus Aenigmarchaeota archaeon]|nr:hypothetical protein [Candidatus Aenigmarchaeota archaeon]